MKLQNHRILLLVLSLLFLSGLVYSQNKLPIRIGMVADSQITTQRGTQNKGMRSKLADRFVNVAIRPVAVEVYSKEILRNLLYKMVTKKNRPDIILYLGDLANSGCSDELASALSVLREFRASERISIPIFVVPGNHDYLGMGNTANTKNRAILCERNPDSTNPNVALSKFQFLDKIATFNRESAQQLPKEFSFGDNFDQISKREKKDGSDCHDHRRYYYSGILRYQDLVERGSTEVLLVDTSDYSNVGEDSDLEKPCDKGTSFWGSLGGISYENSISGITPQIPYVDSKFDSEKFPVKNRLVASHYPPSALFGSKIDGKAGNEKFLDGLATWQLDGGNNFWLYGHTHTPNPYFKSFQVDSARKIEGVNVGSTTDFDPHVIVFGNVKGNDVVVSATSDNIGLVRYGLNLSETSQNVKAMRRVLQKYRTVQALEKHGYTPICPKLVGTVNPFTVFGLNKAYRDLCWKDENYEDARRNVERFISQYEGKRRGFFKRWTRGELIQTLFYIATSLEAQKPNNTRD